SLLMLDLLTYIVYLFLPTVLSLLTYQPVRNSTNDLNFCLVLEFGIRRIIALLIISLIVGFRYEVGVDWEGYTIYFNKFVTYPNLTFSDQYFEFGFFIINKSVAALGLSYGWMFFIVAFISWIFIFK